MYVDTNVGGAILNILFYEPWSAVSKSGSSKTTHITITNTILICHLYGQDFGLGSLTWNVNMFYWTEMAEYAV